MALAAAYQQFLTAPNSSLFADDAALYYVTTTTSYKGAANILMHIDAARNQLKKKKEDILSVIEGHSAIAVEVDTALEFVTSGGAYLPGLDDNFLTDRTVSIPIMHIVSFDREGKILQIRQSWDQGSLLKQLDVIGRTGRNWPIRDSRDQINMIATCVKSSGAVSAAPDTADLAIRSGGNVARDPHGSLSLFAPREESESQPLSSVISPKAGARPRQRTFVEILGDEPEEPSPANPSRRTTESPSKAVAPKAGAGKNFQPSRIFEAEEDDDQNGMSGDVPRPNPYRPNPNKYNHFDFADGSEPQDAPRPGEPTPRKTKHSSQWDFADFVTPNKAKPSKAVRNQDVRHWGTQDDEFQETPAQRKPAPAKPRRDAEAHFEFIDDGLPRDDPRAARPRGATHNSGLGLYKNNLYNEDGDDTAPAEDSRALGNITNLKDRGRDFESHFAMTDSPPAEESRPKPAVGDDRKKVVKMMDANWSAYDSSPSQKENQGAAQNGSRSSKATQDRGIHIGGDGMGGSKGSSRNWFFGEDDDDSEVVKPPPGRKQGAATKSGGFNWDF